MNEGLIAYSPGVTSGLTPEPHPQVHPPLHTGTPAEVDTRQVKRAEMPVGAPFVVAAIVIIQLALPETVSVGPRWAIPALEVVGAAILAMVLALSDLTGRARRLVVSVYLTMLIASSVLNGLLLFDSLLTTQAVPESGEELLLAGFGVLIINVLSFGLVYWELDGGGPAGRELGLHEPDFQFPQQASGMAWHPTLFDYLFTAYTNIIAFSPTDTMPLTHRVKFLFVIQSTVSLVTVLVTLSRAINLI